MPNVGDIVLGKTIGKIGKDGFNSYTWAVCPKCQRSRWVYTCNLRKSKNPGWCNKCFAGQRGKEATAWKGGRHNVGNGYFDVYVHPDDFFYPMARKCGYVLEHRLVMAKALGRNLHRWEIVHHKHTKYPAGSKEDKADNRIENLQLVTDDRHKQITILEEEISFLKRRVSQLETENMLLRGNNGENATKKGKHKTKGRVST